MKSTSLQDHPMANKNTSDTAQVGTERWQSLLSASSRSGIAPEVQQDDINGMDNNGRRLVTSWTCCSLGNRKDKMQLCCIFCSPAKPAAGTVWVFSAESSPASRPRNYRNQLGLGKVENQTSQKRK